MMRPFMLAILLAFPALAAAGDPPAPKPWRTAARIKVQLPEGIASGSGTVIYSNASRSVVLTAAHVVRDAGSRPVAVDLFQPDPIESAPRFGPLQLRFRETHPGKVLSIDPAGDVALVEIRPGRVLEYSPVAPESVVALSPGQPLTAVGCGYGKDATVWSTEVTKSSVSVSTSATGTGLFTATRSEPRQGRSGGGLFTPAGVLVGVCCFGDSRSDGGLYACPPAIRAVLSREGLDCSYGKPCRPGSGCPQVAPPRPPVSQGQAIVGEPGFSEPPAAQVTPTPTAPQSAGTWAEWLAKLDAMLPEGSHLLAGGLAIAALFARDKRKVTVLQSA